MITIPHYAQSANEIRETIIISKGEHHKLHLPNLSHYSIGNPEIIGHKTNSKTSEILIKGKKMGFSELYALSKEKKSFRYQIFVLSKKKQLTLSYVQQILGVTHLKTKLKGPMVIITGELNSIDDYHLFNQVYNKYHEYIHVRANLNKRLKNLIIGKVYKHIFEQNIDNISCFQEHLKIFCRYDSKNPPSKNSINFLVNNYFIKFIKSKNFDIHENFLAELKIFQIEILNSQDKNFGIDQIDGENIFSFKTLSHLLNNNSRLIFSHKNIKIKTLAQPRVILIPEEKSTIKLGNDIPYPVRNENNNLISQNWKFAGLKLSLLIQKTGNNLLLKYQNEFTKSHSSGELSGGKESSSLYVNLNRPIEIFNISHYSEGKNNTQIPFLGKIPLIGALFTGEHNRTQFKKIIGFLTLKRLSND